MLGELTPELPDLRGVRKIPCHIPCHREFEHAGRRRIAQLGLGRHRGQDQRGQRMEG
jgi:hypothetical protein